MDHVRNLRPTRGKVLVELLPAEPMSGTLIRPEVYEPPSCGQALVIAVGRPPLVYTDKVGDCWKESDPVEYGPGDRIVIGRYHRSDSENLGPQRCVIDQTLVYAVIEP